MPSPHVMTKLQHWAIRRAEALALVATMHTEESKEAMRQVAAAYARMIAREAR